MESEEAAQFRAACERHGIDSTNSFELIGIRRSQWYAYCNGTERVGNVVKKLLESMDEAAKLKKTLSNMRKRREVD